MWLADHSGLLGVGSRKPILLIFLMLSREVFNRSPEIYLSYL